MYIKVGNEFADTDYGFLADMLELLDIKLQDIHVKVKASLDPDSEGLLDRGEYLVGMGFSLIQRYINVTYPYSNIDRERALSIPPEFKAELSYMKIINASANYWKHQEEWGLANCIAKNSDSLKGAAKHTVQTIECVSPWAEYTNTNVLAELCVGNEFTLSSLLKHVQRWRFELDQLKSKA